MRKCVYYFFFFNITIRYDILSKSFIGYCHLYQVNIILLDEPLSDFNMYNLLTDANCYV